MPTIVATYVAADGSCRLTATVFQDDARDPGSALSIHVAVVTSAPTAGGIGSTCGTLDGHVRCASATGSFAGGFACRWSTSEADSITIQGAAGAPSPAEGIVQVALVYTGISMQATGITARSA